MKTVLFLGYSGSGKTWALTHIAQTLVRTRRAKIGTIKGIHDSGFTIDSRGKDTWLHASAGASIIAAIAPREVDIIRRGRSTEASLKEVIRVFKRAGVDYLLVEGLHRRFENSTGVKIVICARSEPEARRLAEAHRQRALFITGRFVGSANAERILGIPLISLPRDLANAIDLMERRGTPLPSKTRSRAVGRSPRSRSLRLDRPSGQSSREWAQPARRN